MIRTKLKKVNIIIMRAEQENLLSDLAGLGCIDISTPAELLEDAGLTAIVDLENIELPEQNDKKNKIAARGTDYTIILTGWIPASAEPELRKKLEQYETECAWDVLEPTPDEQKSAPVKLKIPKLYKLFYKKTNRLFTPLAPYPPQKREQP